MCEIKAMLIIDNKGEGNSQTRGFHQHSRTVSGDASLHGYLSVVWKPLYDKVQITAHLESEKQQKFEVNLGPSITIWRQQEL